MADLVDTNILVYRYDSRYPLKQAIATQLLRKGIAEGSLLLPHQAVLEFVSAVTRGNRDKPALFTRDEAYRQAERLLSEFEVIYPTENTVRAAVRGAALYQFSWYDAHLWAYADERGLDTIWSEDFEHGRLYGRVRVCNPFHASVHEPSPPPYGR